MPNIHMPLPETQQNISRPIVIDVVKQVQDITGMEEAIIYYSDDGKMQTTSGTIDSEEERFISTTSKRMNRIEVDEQIDPEEMSPTFFNGREYTPILQDRKLGFTVTPIYAKHNVRISFNYSCGSKTEAQKWLQDMRMKISRLRDINIHSVTYHYNIHINAYEIAQKVYELRETQAGYNQTFEQYIKTHSNPRLTIMGDIVGKNRIFAVAETQTEIYGLYDFDALPSKPEKNEAGMWVIAFDYKFNYDKPIGCHVRYPIIVHNLLMPYELVSFTSDSVRPIEKPTDSSKTLKAFGAFRADRQMDRIKAKNGMILIPSFDDFIPELVNQGTAGVIQGLAVITPDNKRDIISLKDLGDVVIDPEIIKFLSESEYPYLGKPYQSIFNVSLYQNSVLQHYDRITVDSELMIKGNYDLDIRNQYRIRLSVVTDIDLLKPDAIVRLRQYPKVLYLITGAINRAFRENPELSKLGMERYITPDVFSYIYRMALGKEPNIEGIGSIGWTTNMLLNYPGITPQLLRSLRTEFKRPAQTMILGIIADTKENVKIQGSGLENYKTKL